VSNHEIPVEAVERAGGGFGLLLDLVVAVLAVIAHLVDVVAARAIGFGGDQAVIGEQAHATGVGHFHPFDVVDVNAEVPGVHLGRIDTR